MKVVAHQSCYCFHCSESFGESSLYRNYDHETSLFRFSGQQQDPVTRFILSPSVWPQYCTQLSLLQLAKKLLELYAR